MNRILPCFLWCFICIQFNSLPCFIVGAILYFYKYRDVSIILLILLFSYCLYFNIRIVPATTSGRIVQLTTNSIIIENNGARSLISNCDIRDYDSFIEVIGSPRQIESAPSSFGFSFKKWAQQNNISSSVYASSCSYIKKANTLRSGFQKIINNKSDSDLYYKVFFNVSSNDQDFINTLNTLGFPLIGFITLLKNILKRFLYDAHIKWIEGSVLILICLLTGFNFVSMRLLIGFGCRFLKGDAKFRCGIFGIICALLFPTYLTSLGFIIPFGFRLIFATECNKKLARIFFLVIIQSLFFSKIQIGLILFYSVIILIQGLLFALALLNLIIPILNSSIINIFLSPISFLQLFKITGNPLGLGLVLYILIILNIKKYHVEIALGVYLTFILLGLFHPFSEVCFIQIGQGDSILLRKPFNQGNYLIDTGESKNYALLKANLDARSIYELDGIFISHSDLDHSGNLEQLLLDYNVKNVYTNHESLNDETIDFKSINQSYYDNPNDNSQVQIVGIKNLNFLFVADISKSVEFDLLNQLVAMPIDILKVGHHGSNTSTSRELLTKTNPKIAIISSGLNNKYGHPHKETIEILDKFGVFWLDTKNEGDITIIFTRFINLLLTSSGKIGIIS
ncbi:ComEC/Rec2 family competence protein [Anaerorhabdus sp.]|uniref:ComEC/Rec2 family competence protein n=1 Tax=Anaerorhabdus sp. TaxID=1872524 RepID=UPI002FCB5B88